MAAKAKTPEAASGEMEIKVFDVDGQLLRTGIRRGADVVRDDEGAARLL